MLTKLLNAIRINKPKQETTPPTTLTPQVSFEGVPSPNFKVAGVQYKNSDGSDRQAIISKVKTGDSLNFVTTEYEGNPAIAIFTMQNKQIGFVKQGNISRTLKLMEDGAKPIVLKCQKDVENTHYYVIYQLVK